MPRARQCKSCGGPVYHRDDLICNVCGFTTTKAPTPRRYVGRTTPLRRVQAVDQFKTPPIIQPLIQPEAPREITAHGREYVVFWSGGQSLYGSETPRNFGSSLLDSSRIVK